MKCCICHKEIEGYGNIEDVPNIRYGNNAAPVKDGICCSDCNINVVVPNRLNHMKTLRDAAIAQARFTNVIKELNGYETQTTLYGDFTIADAFGVDAVQDTYNRVFKEWQHSAVFMTELSLVLNHKIWEHHHNNNPLVVTYDTLWKIHDEWCGNCLSDEDYEYYLRITD